MPNDTTPATIGADARSSFIRWYAGFLLSDEMHAAHVWDNDHIPAQAWRAALASAAQPAGVHADRAMRAQAAPTSSASVEITDEQMHQGLAAAFAHPRAAAPDAVFKAGVDFGVSVALLQTAPTTQAAPVAQGDAEDAARYRWLRNKSTVLHNTAWLGGATAVQRDVDFLRRDDALAALDAAIDAARKQGANHD